jgi:hypothetical protein
MFLFDDIIVRATAKYAFVSLGLKGKLISLCTDQESAQSEEVFSGIVINETSCTYQSK